jgi:hypothetical protein
VLLPQKPHAIQHLPRSGTSRFQPLLEIGVFDLQALDPLGVDAGTSRRRVERFHARLGLKRASPEGGELISKVPYEPLKLLKSFELRTFAV